LSARAARAALLAVAAACATPTPPVTLSDGRYAMGTVLEATLVARDAQAGRAALDELFAVAERLDSLLNVWDPESEASRLNRAAGRGPQRVSPELAAIVADSLAYARLTRGSFDPGVRPLVELWTRAAERDAPPTAEELAAARARVGAQHVRVTAGGEVELLREGVSLDFGGVAKGWALERMLPGLRARGVEAALLVFGQSSTWALGAPPGERGWRLLARGPDEGFLGVLTLRDRALSVSGSLGQWFEIGGRRYGHVLDPRSGQPLLRRRQALVVAPDAALAEALSKALLVLGEDEGIALVHAQPGCAALLVDADGGRWETPGWAEAVSFEPAPDERLKGGADASDE
jgi:thiamine biosynthesis lipoprotein